MRRPIPAPEADGRPFSGFPDSGLATTVPSLFFSRVLPEIQSVEELAVTVYFFFAQSAAAGARRSPRFLTRRELEADATLMRSLVNLCGGEDGRALERGLDLETLRRDALGRQVTVKVPRYWTPLDPTSWTRSVPKLEQGERVLFDQTK